MTRYKSVHTKEDIKGLLYIIDYLMKNHYPLVTELGTSDFQDIERIINKGHNQNIKESTIRRICTFRRKPTRLSYAKLDIFTQWCFDGDGNYDNFRQFLKECQNQIQSLSSVTDKDVTLILKTISSTKALVSKNVNIDLGNIPVSFNLGEGFIAKLIEEVSIVTGDLLTKKIKNNPNQFGIFPNQRIQNRVSIRETRWQTNIENIVAKAIDFAKYKEASDTPVDPDWIIYFFNLAQDCSDDKMQYLWAKILAGEIENSGNFSKRTLNVLKSISQEEAKLFSLLSNCLWTLDGVNVSGTKVLIKESDENNEYTDFYWGFDRRDLYLLEDMGLIEESLYILDTNLGYDFKFFNIKHSIKSSKERTEMDVIRLTKVGEEIYSIVQKSMNTEYYEHIKNYLQKNEIIG